VTLRRAAALAAATGEEWKYFISYYVVNNPAYDESSPEQLRTARHQFWAWYDDVVVPHRQGSQGSGQEQQQEQQQQQQQQQQHGAGQPPAAEAQQQPADGAGAAGGWEAAGGSLTDPEVADFDGHVQPGSLTVDDVVLSTQGSHQDVAHSGASGGSSSSGPAEPAPGPAAAAPHLQPPEEQAPGLQQEPSAADLGQPHSNDWQHEPPLHHYEDQYQREQEQAGHYHYQDMHHGSHEEGLPQQGWEGEGEQHYADPGARPQDLHAHEEGLQHDQHYSHEVGCGLRAEGCRQPIRLEHQRQAGALPPARAHTCRSPASCSPSRLAPCSCAARRASGCRSHGRLGLPPPCTYLQEEAHYHAGEGHYQEQEEEEEAHRPSLADILMQQAAASAAGQGEQMYFDGYGDQFGGGHFQEQAVVVEDPGSLRDPFKTVREGTTSGEEEH
jgi:hypothetical protein